MELRFGLGDRKSKLKRKLQIFRNISVIYLKARKANNKAS